MNPTSYVIPNMLEREEWRRMTDEQRHAEYEICQRRGHQPSNTTLTTNPPQHQCRWCGTAYRFTEPTLVEGSTP